MRKKTEHWSDSKFKTLFLIVMVIALIPSILLLSQTRPMEDKYKTLMENKKVYILDPAGQSYYVSASDTEENTFYNIGVDLLDDILAFDYTGSLEKIKHLSQYTTKEVLNKQFAQTEKLRDQVKTVSGSFQVNSIKRVMEKTNKGYNMYVHFNHDLISQSQNKSDTYIIKLEMVRGSVGQESTNYTGVYLKDFEIYEGDKLKDQMEELNIKIKSYKGEE